MKILYMAHSGTRYLVLLLALALIVYCVVGLATKGKAGRPCAASTRPSSASSISRCSWA